MVFEENIFKTEVGFIGLSKTNEVVKKIKFEKVSFNVVVRIRQSLSKTETEIVEDTKLVLEKVYTPFSEYLLAN